MDYAKAREGIRSGDMLAWSHRGWRSWYDIQVQAVRVFTESEYCHVGVAWVVAGRVFVIEAVTPKVRIFPLSKLTPFYWLPMEAPWRADTEAFAIDHVGEPYSKLEAVMAFFRPLKPDGMWQCAKFVQAVLMKDGIDLGQVVTPTALVMAAQQQDAPLYLVR